MSRLGNAISKKYNTPYLTENKVFCYKVLYELEEIKDSNREIVEFLYHVIPKTDKIYYIYVDRKYPDGKRWCNIACNYYEYINKLSRMADMEYNIYFSPVSYYGWRCDGEVIEQYKSIYIDIDDLGCDISDMEADELISYIAKRSNIETFDCSFLLKSGKGCHLYWRVDDIESENQRKEIVKGISTFFKSDIACVPPSHFVRLPLSLNVKREVPVRSKLYNISNKSFTVAELSKYVSSQSEIDEYFASEKDKTSAKQKETRAKNRDGKNNLEETSVEELHIIIDKNMQIDSAEDYDYEDYDIETDEWLSHYEALYTNTKTWEYRQLQAIKDLVMWLQMRGGYIEGYRNKFCVCFSSKAHNIINCDKCIAILNSLLPDYSLEEIRATVESVYKKKNFEVKDKSKTITNVKMAEMLGFKKSEIKRMSCTYNFSERNEKRNKKYALTKGVNHKNKKETQRMFVAENADRMTNQQIAEYLNISISTVKRLKNEIKEKVA